MTLKRRATWASLLHKPASKEDLQDVTNGSNADHLHVHDHSSLSGVTADQHHAESHAVASHSDTSATGAQLDTLVGGGATTLHSHPGGGAGDVLGPAGATDEALARYDGATGKLIQDGPVKSTDAGAVTGITTLNMSGALTVGGTVDGRDLGAADGPKLDGIEPLADVTAAHETSHANVLVDADIGVNVQAHAAVLDGTTASYTAAEESKLAGIEAAADVTDVINVDAAGAVMGADTSLVGTGFFLDEDDMASDDATKVPSQQSVKAYADSQIGLPGKSWLQIRNGAAQNLNVVSPGTTVTWVNGGSIVGSDMSHSTTINPGRVTFNTAGIYVVTANVRMTSTVQRGAVTIRTAKNGTLTGPSSSSGYIRAASGHNAGSCHIGSFILGMAATDYLEINAMLEAAAGTVNTVPNECYLSIFRIS